MKKILVVCHGAINRSPASAGVMRHLCKDKLDVQVRALKVYPEKSKLKATKKIREALMNHKIDISEHRAKTIDQVDVDWADIIVYMDGGNLKRLQNRFNHSDLEGKLYCLGNSIGKKRIADPNFFAKDSQEFKDIFTDIVLAATKFTHDHTN